MVSCWVFFYVYTPCYISSDEKGIESAAGKTVQDVK
jgi:hypothetical protein